MILVGDRMLIKISVDYITEEGLHFANDAFVSPIQQGFDPDASSLTIERSDCAL